VSFRFLSQAAGEKLLVSLQILAGGIQLATEANSTILERIVEESGDC